MADISACIITFNEKDNIERCLSSLFFCDEIILVDAGSDDCTVEKAKKFTNKIYSNEFIDFSTQKNYAIKKAKSEWILSIDADEVIPDELAEEIVSTTENNKQIDAFMIGRINNMYGKELRHFAQPDHNIRLFKKGSCYFVQPVHEYVECTGEIGVLKNKFFHYSISCFSEHMKKAQLYTNLEVKIVIDKRGYRPFIYFINMLMNPLLRFFQNYFFLKGYKEGFTGFTISFNAGLVELIKYYKCFKICVIR